MDRLAQFHCAPTLCTNTIRYLHHSKYVSALLMQSYLQSQQPSDILSFSNSRMNKQTNEWLKCAEWEMSPWGHFTVMVDHEKWCAQADHSRYEWQQAAIPGHRQWTCDRQSVTMMWMTVINIRVFVILQMFWLSYMLFTVGCQVFLAAATDYNCAHYGDL